MEGLIDLNMKSNWPTCLLQEGRRGRVAEFRILRLIDV